MNQLDQRALYNLLRMNWLNDPSLPVESWQVEDYRQLPLSELFERLQPLSIHLDKHSFVAYANDCDSPEDLTSYLIGDQKLNAMTEDKIYLLVFELWRRLLTEKPSLSIFCDELDHQIYQYDQGQSPNAHALQDALDDLITVLEENVDQGIKPTEAFPLVISYCANNVESFLYDFILEQLESDHDSYAQELLEAFSPYVKDNKWFDLLQARLACHLHPKAVNKWLTKVMDEHLKEPDLDYHLELLSIMLEVGTPTLFRQLVQQTLPLLKIEEDFQDLLFIMADYYHRLDQEKPEALIQQILQKRRSKSSTDPLNPKDPDLMALLTS